MNVPTVLRQRSLSQQFLARYAAVLFAIVGAITLLNYGLPRESITSEWALVWVGLLSLALAGAIWGAPWKRMPPWTLYLLPVVAILVKTAGNYFGAVGRFSYAPHFILIFLWIGLALPRWSSLLYSPLLLAAYLYPLARAGYSAGEMASAAVVIPICILVGESMSWVARRLHLAEETSLERLEGMKWLVSSSAELARPTEVRHLAERVGHLATVLGRARSAAVFLVDEDRSLIRTATAGDVPDLDETVVPERFPAVLRVLQRGAPLVPDETAAKDLAAQLGTSSVAVLPLTGLGAPIGVILLFGAAAEAWADPFRRNLAGTFSVHAGLGLERSRLTRDLIDATLHDPLTGVGNRRKAQTSLDTLAPGDALMMVDLDHFKNVNDTHGHATGDRVLRDLAAYLRFSMRRRDEVFRMGGEEFLIILRQPRDATAAAARLLGGWRALRPLTTFSAGVAVYDGSSAPMEVIRIADAALYDAKAAGRDRVCAPAA